jgi:uncharacterized protein YjbI with pentapeptide repeats
LGAWIRWQWVVLGAAFAALFAAPAYACSCMLDDRPDAFVSAASIIVNATQQRIDPCRAGDNLDGCVVGTFIVNEVFKGPPASEVRISYHRSVGTSCQFGLPTGRPVTIAGYGDLENGFTTGGCPQYQMSDHNYFLAAIRYRQRLALFDRALEKAPTDPVLLRRKAGFLQRNGEIDQGLDTIERLLAQVPNDRAGLTMKAELLVAKGKDAEARDILGTLVPSGDLAAHELAKLRARQGREEPAAWLDFEGIESSNFALDYRHSLDGASFRNARLISPDLSRRSLRGADFTNAVLSGARFDYADLTEAILRGARIDGMFREAILTNADLEGADGELQFFESKLDGLWAPSVNLANVKFMGGSAKGAVFAHGKFTGGVFEALDLSGADLSYADLSGAYLGHVNLSGANLARARLLAFEGKAVDLKGANLEGANLDGTLMTSAVYDCTTRWPTGFDPGKAGAVNLEPNNCPSKADFSWWREPALFSRDGLTEPGYFEGQALSGVSFHGAWLPTDSFRGATLMGADLARASGPVDISGADLMGADLSFVDLLDWKLDAMTNLKGVKLRGARVDWRVLSEHPDRDAVVPDGAIVWYGTLPDGIDPTARQIVLLHPAGYPEYHLRKADLRGYDLRDGAFGALDFSGADLRGAALMKADFSSATLTGANLRGACYGKSTRWPAGFDPAAAGVVYCSERYSNRWWREEQTSFWAASSGKGAWRKPPAETPIPDLAGENLSETNLLGAWLPGSKLDGAKFRHTRLKASNLEGASMRKADLTGANLRDATLAQADLTGAILRRADLRQASLAGATLDGADLTGAIFDYVTVWPEGFDPVAAGATNVEQ